MPPRLTYVCRHNGLRTASEIRSEEGGWTAAPTRPSWSRSTSESTIQASAEEDPQVASVTCHYSQSISQALKEETPANVNPPTNTCDQDTFEAVATTEREIPTEVILPTSTSVESTLAHTASRKAQLTLGHAASGPAPIEAPTPIWIAAEAATKALEFLSDPPVQEATTDPVVEPPRQRVFQRFGTLELVNTIDTQAHAFGCADIV